MKKLLWLLTSLLLLASFVGAAQWVNLTGPASRPAAQVLQSTDATILLDFQVSGFEKSEISINGQAYTLIGIDREGKQWIKGAPELPRICRSVIIPDNALMQARVRATEYQDIPNILIAPSKGHLLRTIDPATVPYEFGSVYQADAWFPQDIVQLSAPFIMRDFRGQTVELSAFQYNPVRQILRVYTKVSVEINNVGTGGENVLVRNKPLTHFIPEFREIYQTRFLNFDQDRYPMVDEVGSMLVITYDGFHNDVQPLVDWKNQKGIATTLVNVSTIGNNFNAIKTYITNLYNTSDLAYVLLVGDAAQVATSGVGLDPTYALLAGGDHYPDLFVGRFSAETNAQAINQVTRTLTYEKQPMPAGDWYHKGTGIASDQGPGHYGEYDFEHVDLIRQDLLRFTYTEMDQIYDPFATQAMISNALNNGRSIIVYCGHGSQTSWGTTGFSNTNVNALTNANMLPFAFSVACVNGAFTSITCFAEAWLRASAGGQPTGAIGFYGSSQNQSWDPPMYAEDESIDLLVGGSKTTYGGLCFNGASYMVEVCGSTGQSEFDHWHIFGDPSIQVRTATPTAISAIHDNQISMGQQTFVVQTGISSALAALYYDGDLLGSAYADTQGVATIVLPPQLPVGYLVTLTVTAFNKIPYFVEIPVVSGGPDIWPPAISHTPLTNTISSGPYVVNAVIQDYSGVLSASVFWSTNGVNFTEVAMTNPSGNNWTGNIPGQAGGTTVTYYIRATDNSPQHNVGNTSNYSFIVLAIIFEDLVETGVGSWTHDVVTPGWTDQWHISTEINHSPTHSWKFGDPSTGNYANHADGGLVSGPITLGDECQLTFWHWINAEASSAYPDSAYDGGVVDISLGGGPWAILNMSPGYTHHIRSQAGGGNPYSGPFTPGMPCFSGNSGGWVQQTADLSTYAGDIRLRFRFGSDNSGNNEGWYIDDLRIVGMPTVTPPPLDINTSPVNPPIVIPANGGSFQYSMNIHNTGTTPETFQVWNKVRDAGNFYVQVFGPVTRTLPGGANPTRTLTQTIAGSISSGTLYFISYIGNYPSTISDSSFFTITKSAVGDGGPSIAECYGSGNFFDEYATVADAAIPNAYSLGQNYPNPFNPTTAISYQLSALSFVNLSVYDISGKKVAELVNGWREAGSHSVTFDAAGLASGVYLYKLKAGSFSDVQKMVLMK